MSAYTQEQIVRGCLNKERQMQEYLYKTYYSRFLKVCARYAKTMDDAEQLINDGFLKIFNRVGDFENKGSFEGWMNRIMINTCLDHLKSSYFKNAIKMHVNNGVQEEPEIPIQSDAISKMEFKELVKLVQSLPVMSQTVFNLYVFEGYTHPQIAKTLDISEGTSHWHVHHARNLLKEKIKKNESLNQLYESKRV